jgi:hypothetical protein
MQVVAESVAQHDYERVARDKFLDAVRQRHARVLSAVGSRIGADLAGDALARALQWQGDPSESHPTLTDRLRALNVNATDGFTVLLNRATEPRVPSAADSLLRKSSRDALEDYLGALTRIHPHLLQPLTEEEKRTASDARAALSSLEGSHAEGRLDADGKTELVRRWRDAGRTDDAAQLAREVLASAPDALVARFILGSALLQRMEAEGVVHMEVVAASDGEITRDAFMALADFWERRGNRQKRDDALERWSAWHARNAEELEDASSRKVVPRLHPARLSAAERAGLRATAAAVYGTGRVYAVMHASRTSGKNRLTVYLFRKGLLEPDEDEQEALRSAFSASFHFNRPGVFVAPTKRNKWQKKLDRIPEALVYDNKVPFVS